MINIRVTLYNRRLVVALKNCSLALVFCLSAAAIGPAQSISGRVTGAGSRCQLHSPGLLSRSRTVRALNASPHSSSSRPRRSIIKSLRGPLRAQPV